MWHVRLSVEHSRRSRASATRRQSSAKYDAEFPDSDRWTSVATLKVAGFKCMLMMWQSFLTRLDAYRRRKRARIAVSVRDLVLVRVLTYKGTTVYASFIQPSFIYPLFRSIRKDKSVVVNLSARFSTACIARVGAVLIAALIELTNDMRLITIEPSWKIRYRSPAAADCICIDSLWESEPRWSVNLRSVLTATSGRAAAFDIRRRCRHHKGGTVLRLATVGASSTRRRINQPQRVRCVLFAYQVPPGAVPRARQSVTNFCASAAARRRRVTSAANRRPRGVRGKAESECGTTTSAPVAAGRPARRAEKSRAVPYRAGPVVSCYTMLHQRLVEHRWTGLFRRERVGGSTPLTATLRLT